MEQLAIPLGILILIVQIINGRFIYLMKKIDKEKDRRISKTESDILQNELKLNESIEKRDKKCEVHTSIINDLNIKIGQRKGENELLSKDLQRLEDIMKIQLKSISDSQKDIKDMLKALIGKKE